MARNQRVRLNLEFPPKVANNLERLADLSESSSRTEVIRKALKLFDLVLSHREEGGKLVLEHQDGSQETVQFL